MSTYRDDREAARARVEALESQLAELTNAATSREVDVAALRAEVARLRRGPRRDRAWAASAAVVAAVALVVGVIAVFRKDRSEPTAVSTQDPDPVKVVAVVSPPSDAEMQLSDPGAAGELPMTPGRQGVLVCYAAELSTRSDLTGALKIHTIWASGKVTEVVLEESPIRSARFDACVEKALVGHAVLDTPLPVEVVMDFVWPFQ